MDELRINCLCFFEFLEAGDVAGSAATVTSTRLPFLSFTSSPCSSVNAFSIRRSRCPRSGPSTYICAFSGWLRREDGMILSTIPGTVALACSGFRVVSNFSSATLADLAMRGFAISFLTLAVVALLRFFLAFLCSTHTCSHGDGNYTVPFRTVASPNSYNWAWPEKWFR